MRHAVMIAALALVASPVRPADACSYAFPDGWGPGYDTPTVDDSPPAPPTVVGISVSRNPLGCGERRGGGDCAGTATITIEVAAGADDQTPRERMGFRLEDSEGNRIGNPFLLDARNETLIVYSDDGGDLALTYTLVQIDLGNNESTPVTFEVVDEEGGCAAGGSATSWWLIAGAALVAVRRRRARATT